jgi:hypothetical protein
MRYKSLSGVTQLNFLELRSNNFFVLCCACFSSFYGSLCVHNDFDYAWIFVCASKLHFNLHVMCHLGCFVLFVLHVLL